MSNVIPFKLGTFVAGNKRFAGIVVGDVVGDIARLVGVAAVTLEALLERWEESFATLCTLATQIAEQRTTLPADAVHPLASLRAIAPLAPRQVLQAGANYAHHVVDLMVAQGTARPDGMSEDQFRTMALNVMRVRATHGEPYVFVGLPSALCGPADDIELPPYSAECDWELELGVVFSKSTFRVRRENAYDHVAGYVIANDITTRDRVYRPDLPPIGTDWMRSKNAPTCLPIGPYFVPKEFVPKPMSLRLTLRLNGEVKQDETTADMIYDIPRLIEHVSTYARLGSGDLLLTGSPAGNGAKWGRFLRPGDVMEAEIEGLGMQRNLCVASPIVEEAGKP